MKGEFDFSFISPDFIEKVEGNITTPIFIDHLDENDRLKARKEYEEFFL